MIAILEIKLVNGQAELKLRRQIPESNKRAVAREYLQRRGTQCYFVRWQGALRPTTATPMVVDTNRFDVRHEIVNVRGNEIVFAPYADLYPNWPDEWDRLGLWLDLPSQSVNPSEHEALLYINESSGLPLELLPYVELSHRFQNGQTAVAAKGSGLILQAEGSLNGPGGITIATKTNMEISIISKTMQTSELILTWIDIVPGVRKPVDATIEMRRLFRLLQAAQQRSLAVVATIPFQRDYGPVILQFRSVDAKLQLHVELDQLTKVL